MCITTTITRLKVYWVSWLVRDLTALLKIHLTLQPGRGLYVQDHRLFKVEHFEHGWWRGWRRNLFDVPREFPESGDRQAQGEVVRSGFRKIQVCASRRTMAPSGLHTFVVQLDVTSRALTADGANRASDQAASVSWLPLSCAFCSVIWEYNQSSDLNGQLFLRMPCCR